MKNILKYLICIPLVAIFCGCSLNIPPPDQFSDPDAITTVSTARSLLTSAYISYPHYEYQLSILGEDFCPTSLSGKDVEQQNLYRWQDNSITELADEVWGAYYTTIAYCDVLLERLPNVAIANASEENEKAVIASETKALKALCYFRLLQLFATPYHKNIKADGVVIKTRIGVETIARSSKEVCVNYIRTLLLEAVSTDNVSEKNGWLSQKAVYHILSQLELYAGNYTKAAEYAEEVLSDADESLFTGTNYRYLWSANSYEGRIFAFNSSTTYYTSIQYDEPNGDYFAVNPNVKYAQTDVRKEYNIYPFTMSGESRNLFGKYNMNNRKGEPNNYVEMMRYAEAYFIAAEAYCRDGYESKGVSKPNHYLTLCGAEEIPSTLSGDELINRIVDEKLLEFVGEGVNYLDIKRISNSDLKRYAMWGKSTYSTIRKDSYKWTFPIPSSEYRYNEAVSQNEGWPINR